MTNGQPFNLLKNTPLGGLPVVVSKAKKAVWAGPRSVVWAGQDGLGEFRHHPPRLVGPVEWWSDQYDPRADYPLYYNGNDDAIHKPSADFCFRKLLLRRRCDRILIAQNCTIEPAEVGGEPGTKLNIPGNFQWYAPRTGVYKSDFSSPTAGEARVRPWCGPAGDIDGWTTEPYASFLPYTWRFSPDAEDWEYGHGNPLNIAAWSLFSEWNIPEEWGLDGRPVFRVQYPRDKRSFTDPPYSGFGDLDDAKSYILTPAADKLPFKVIFWAKIPEDTILRDVREWLVEAKTDRDYNALKNRMNVPTNGDAFDLMLYTVPYWEKEETWTGAAEDWDNADWDRSDPGYEIARWWRCVARIVKELPPRQEGGA